ncbi:MAG: hypothetical protein U0M12_00610 [Acutalibacteraceae bacterium]|nr:hypothetical protein [Acutalibacteraceae bacterium]
MTDTNQRPGFFKLYFKNFKPMLVGNLLFAVPAILAVALIYCIAKLINQTTNLWLMALVIPLVYPFYSGVTQITKDIVRNSKEKIKPVELYKKGVKNNFWYFALYGIILYVSLIISYYSIVIYFKLATSSWIFYIPLFVTILIALFILFMSFSIPILTVTLELKLKHYFKNSVLMAFGELPMNFYVAVTSMVLISGCLSVPLYTGDVRIGIIVLLIALVLILPTGISYCSVYRLYPKMERLFEIEPKDEEKSFPTMPVAVPTDDEGNPIHKISDDDEEYIFVNGKMIKKSQAPSAEYIDESD